MDLREIMQEQVFAVVGDTLNEEKYAYKIKHALLGHGYTVHAVGKELASLNDVPGRIGVIDLCINPARGLALMEGCTKPFTAVIIQPGAESPELLAHLDARGVPYVQGCALVGLSLYAREAHDK